MAVRKPAPTKKSSPEKPTTGKVGGWASSISNMKKNWKEAKTNAATDDGGSGPPDVPDGSYFARCAKMATFEKEGIPGVRLQFIIMSGDYQGLQPTKFIRLRNKNNPEDTQGIEWYFKTLRRLGYPNIIETDIEETPEVCVQVTKDQHYCSLAIKNTVKDNRRYQECYVNRELDENGDPVEE